MRDGGTVMQPAWPIYVISLRSATERRARCADALARLGLRFEFFDAVEGAKLAAEEVARLYDPRKNARVYKHALSRPEMGCTLSHYSLWQRISTGDAGGAFLLEDDFQAEPGLAEVMAAISRASLKNCMVKLFSREPAGGDEVGELPGGYKLVMPRHVPGQTVGYAIDSIAAARLAAKAMPMARPVDMDIKHWWEFDVPVLMVQPSPLRVNVQQTGSSIEVAREKKHVGGLSRAWRNVCYQLAYNAGVRANRKRERQHLERLQAALRSADGR